MNCVKCELYFYGGICYLSARKIYIELKALASSTSFLSIQCRQLNQLKKQLITSCKNVIRMNHRSDVVCNFGVCLAIISIEFHSMFMYHYDLRKSIRQTSS